MEVVGKEARQTVWKEGRMKGGGGRREWKEERKRGERKG